MTLLLLPWALLQINGTKESRDHAWQPGLNHQLLGQASHAVQCLHNEIQ